MFSMLFCICSAAPVLAEPTTPSAEESSPALPSAEEVTSALTRSEAEAHAEQEKLEEEWATPQAEQEREESLAVYAGLSSPEAQSLLFTAFPEQIEALNADPGRVLSNLAIQEPLGSYAALVENEDGGRAIVESSVPVESEVGENKKAPLDLSLEAQGDVFVPRNPLSELELPASAEGQVWLEGGIEVRLPGENPHEAVQVGDMTLFYPETQAATDTVAAALAGGVELLEQLRSPESPEQFRFDLSLPSGATLQPRSDGGAEVVSGSGEVLKEVPPPTAVDAQGREVPVSMFVKGESLVVAILHRSLEVAYPILLDPSFLSDTPAFTSGEWTITGSGGPYDLWNEGSALHVASRGWQIYEPYTYGQFVYSAPGTSAFIEEASFSNISFFTGENATNGCGTTQPHGYVGIFNVATGFYTSPGAGEFKGGNGYTLSYTAKNGGPNVRLATVGIGNGASQIWIKCNHELFVGGVTLKESDSDNPWIKSVSGVPSGWFDPQKAGQVTIVAADNGFGVSDIAIYNGEVTNRAGYGCTGVSGSRCANERSWTIPPPYKAGERTLEVFAEDPLGHTALPKWTTTTKVDNEAPAIELSGQFAEATEEVGKKGAENEADENKLSFPVYNLTIKATDGLETPKEQRQSGVKNIKVYLDGVQQTVPWVAQGCATYSCKKEGTYQLKLLGQNLTAGEHKLKVVAEDQVGHEGEREIEFEYIPATGIDDEYVMQRFPLPNGEGNEAEEENPVRPELAVNVMNGNLVYRQQDVEVTGPGADLEVERFYNSQLPKAQNTEWGAGWTLAQTPELEIEQPKSGAPTDAILVDENGAVEGSVDLPTATGGQVFDKEIQAVVTKEANGYEVADESGETDSAVAFNQAGEPVELRSPGAATVEVESEAGVLSELGVDDPATAGGQAAQSIEEPAKPHIYASSFGGEGTGAGNLAAPVDAATDAEGNVWVADAGHNRIQEFNSKGEFIQQFGATGTGTGQFTSMRSIAIDAQGNVWVAAASRVQEFNSKGEFLRAFGGAGEANGQFRGLVGIAIDPQGQVWALDSGNEGLNKARLQEFSSEGAFLTKYEYVLGKENGQLKNPQDLTIDAAGNFWVADTANHRVVELAPNGTFLRTSGSEGTGNGQFRSPKGIGTDGGKIWVSDTGNNRIQQLSSLGVYLAQFGKSGNNNGQFSEPKGITVDTKGNVWVADTANDRVQEITAGAYVRQFGGEGTGAGNLAAPVDAATDAEGNVWVADAGHNRIQEFNSKGEFIQQFGATGTGTGQFTSMRSIAIDAQGNVWVAAASRVQEFNSKGEFLRAFGGAGEANGQFRGLVGIAIDPQGQVWALDSGNEGLNKARLQEFSSEGAFLTKYEYVLGKENGQLKNPQDLTIDAAGNFWVADTANHRVVELAPNGTFLRTSGSEGTGNGQFRSPKGIGTDGGKIWVSDTGNNRIQQLSSLGVYLAQFGKSGNNNGQFSEPKGITVDTKGNVWVADTANDRVQRWMHPGWGPSYFDPVDEQPAALGQLAGPTGIAGDKEGNVWVADTGHNRVQEFNSKGELVRQFGAMGSANGLFNEPRGIAVDPAGNVWVADKGNYRIQEFNAKGEFIRKFGTAGNGNGQFGRLRGVAVDSEDHVWTIEMGTEGTGKPRVQEFTSEGTYIRQFGSEGTGAGQFKEPQGIAVDAKGNVWVADTANKRVQKFSSQGQYLYSFGAPGSGEGQLVAPSGIAADKGGNVWVADSSNNRITEFSPEGIFLRQFGTAGSGVDQVAGPKGLTLDSLGNFWVADTANNRAAEWLQTSLPPDPPAPESNPSVEVSTSSGMVSSVEGEDAGTTAYTHSADKLTAVSGPRGNTTYQYDTSGRLTKVSLPKGTWGEVKYDSVGRVWSVKTSIEGAPATTTYFEYTETPRRTVVTPEKGRATTYEIAADGSILKWWNSTKAPTIEPLEGSLWYQRGEVHPEPASPGDQTLSVLAKSVEGIASIQVVANGNQVVAEKICDQDWAVAGVECQAVEKTFVTETENWPPGILQFEVIVTDREGLISTKRFWDNIPYTPPPDPEAIEPPTFEDIQRFRNEFGLDLDLAGNERAINDRIFQLIATWHDGNTVTGEVARAAWERWGVPMSPRDVAEMEYRETYLAHDLPLIEEWSEEHHGSTYGGYSVDHPAGGPVYVGFTSNQQSTVGELQAQLPLMAPDRVFSKVVPPASSLQNLKAVEATIEDALETNEVLDTGVVELGVDESTNAVVVGATNVEAVRDAVYSVAGYGAPVKVYPEEDGEPLMGRYQASGRIQAGDAVTGLEPLDNGKTALHKCTANFGAWEPLAVKPNGEVNIAHFLLVAGHCARKMGLEWARSAKAEPTKLSDFYGIGTAKRTGAPGEGQHYETDAAAIRLDAAGLLPRTIYKTAEKSRSVGFASAARHGETLCFSGVATNQVKCGEMVGVRYRRWPKAIGRGRHLFIITRFAGIPGDSGAPVWSPRTGYSIGILSGGPNKPGLVKDWVTPLVRPRGFSVEKVPGALHAPGMGSLFLAVGS
jgi:YD repeat-containing protein